MLAALNLSRNLLGGAGLGGCTVQRPAPLSNANLCSRCPRCLCRLAALNLSRNPLGGAGLGALCDGLQHAATLRILNLAATELTPDDVPALHALSLVRMLRGDRSGGKGSCHLPWNLRFAWNLRLLGI